MTNPETRCRLFKVGSAHARSVTLPPLDDYIQSHGDTVLTRLLVLGSSHMKQFTSNKFQAVKKNVKKTNL